MMTGTFSQNTSGQAIFNVLKPVSTALPIVYFFSLTDRAGFMARSPEGHAARSMSIRGQEELWIQIQANTFKNWASVTLSEAGGPSITEDLETAFQDGTKLVALVETLQKRKLKHNKHVSNQHQEMENIQIALDAIKEDGITLINIGKPTYFLSK